MNEEQLQKLLEQVKTGSLNITEAIEKLRHLPFEDLGFAKIDHHRQIRCSYPEVIYCPGKTTDQIVDIFGRLAKKGDNVLATRASRGVFEAIEASSDYDNLRFEEVARIIVLEQKPLRVPGASVTIVTAGTADMPVASEAKVTAEIMGQEVSLICDVGVAGLHRLLEHVKTLQQSCVIIVVAGMEGALASVVGGLVDCPVIAVPTSVGYGANFEGLAALLTMLNSCAAGVTVVNIDNGFGAAYAASMINSKITQKGE